MPERLAFIWENLGPTHDDRLRAAAAEGHQVTAIQFSGRSNTYSWRSESDGSYAVDTLFAKDEPIRLPVLAWRLARAIRTSRAQHVFFCHYELPAVFLVAALFRLFGRRHIVLMMNSKFDDRPRQLWRELVKRVMLMPYRSCLTSSRRSRDYIAFLGVDRGASVLGYNTIDIARIKEQAGPIEQAAFAERPFVIVARLVPKKNIAMALEAMARFCRTHGKVRRLVILGDGPLEAELRAQAEALDIGDCVEFCGFVQTREVSRVLGTSLALILPSVEEQFGFVINEAMAMGVPVICSANAGAVDILVRNGVNGFVIDPYDVETVTSAMTLLHADPAMHEEMARSALETAPRGDTQMFAKAVNRLIAVRDQPVGEGGPRLS